MCCADVLVHPSLKLQMKLTSATSQLCMHFCCSVVVHTAYSVHMTMGYCTSGHVNKKVTRSFTLHPNHPVLSHRIGASLADTMALTLCMAHTCAKVEIWSNGLPSNVVTMLIMTGHLYTDLLPT